VDFPFEGDLQMCSRKTSAEPTSGNGRRRGGPSSNGGARAPGSVVPDLLLGMGFSESPMPSAISRVDDGAILECNEALCAVTEYRHEEILAMTAFDLGVWDAPADRQEFIRRLQESGVARDRSAALRTKSGHELRILFSARLIESGPERYLVSTITDVSELLAAELAQTQRRAIERSVAFTASTLLESPNWETRVVDVLARLGEATRVSRAYLFRTRRAHDGSLQHTHRAEWVASGVRPLIDDVSLQGSSFEGPGTGRWAEILAQGGSVQGNVLSFPEPERSVFEARDVVSVAIVPIYTGSEWWGFLGFDECDSEREWSSGEIEALQATAGALGAAIERRRAERRIEEAEERYRTLVEQLPGIVYVDAVEDTDPPRFTTTYISPRGEQIHGYTPEEIRSGTDHWAGILHPEDRERAFAQDVHHYRTGEALDAEYRVIAKDGRVLWFHDVATLVTDEVGRPKYSQGIQFDITERKRTEEALRAQDLSFSRVVETIAEGVLILDLEGRVTFANSAAERILGMSREEIVGRHYLDPVWQLGKADGLPLAPEDRPFARVLDTGHPVHGVELSRLRPDGTRSVWSTNGALLPDPSGAPIGVVLSLRDIGEARRAEDQRREAEARYRTLIEQIPAVSYVWDSDPGVKATFSYVSPQIASLLGYSREEWEEDGNLWIERLHPEDRERLLEATDHSASTGERFSEEYRYVARDGRIVWVHDESVLLSRTPDGRPSLFQGVIYDISELKRAGEAVKEALRREQEAADRLRNLDEMKNAFLQAVSHELRTPLTSILGFALTLEQQEGSLSQEQRRDLVAPLAANARKLKRLLSDLLDVDRLARGLLEPRLAQVDLGALVRSVVDETDTQGHAVEIHADPVMALVEAPKIERILENLLANAVRHTPDGTRIWVRLADLGDEILIEVEDDGPGIPSSLKTELFQAFRQGDDQDPHSPGTGIGLALVAGFTKLHGGRVEVADRPSGGVSFKVFLPREFGEPNRADPRASSAGRSERP
jgi:PAS domain S-box-containing protein